MYEIFQKQKYIKLLVHRNRNKNIISRHVHINVIHDMVLKHILKQIFDIEHLNAKNIDICFRIR